MLFFAVHGWLGVGIFGGGLAVLIVAMIKIGGQGSKAIADAKSKVREVENGTFEMKERVKGFTIETKALSELIREEDASYLGPCQIKDQDKHIAANE